MLLLEIGNNDLDQDDCLVTMKSVVLNDGEMENLKFKIKLGIDEIQEKFASLQTQIRLSLKKNSVPVQNVTAHVIACGLFGTAEEKSKFAGHDSHENVFIALTNYWSFLDYDLLISIVKNCGSQEDQDKLDTYDEELRSFCQRRVSEAQGCFPLQKEHSESGHCEEIKIKLNQSDPRLSTIKDLKYRICKVMKIVPSVLQIIDVHDRCVEVKFFIPRHSSHEHFSKSLTDEQHKALGAVSVISISSETRKQIVTVS